MKRYFAIEVIGNNGPAAEIFDTHKQRADGVCSRVAEVELDQLATVLDALNNDREPRLVLDWKTADGVNVRIGDEVFRAGQEAGQRCFAEAGVSVVIVNDGGKSWVRDQIGSACFSTRRAADEWELSVRRTGQPPAN